MVTVDIRSVAAYMDGPANEQQERLYRHKYPTSEPEGRNLSTSDCPIGGGPSDLENPGGLFNGDERPLGSLEFPQVHQSPPFSMRRSASA